MLKTFVLIILLSKSIESSVINIEDYIKRDREKKRDATISLIADKYNIKSSLVQYIYHVSNDYDVDFLLMIALINQESSFIENALSKVGAVGLCQITGIVLIDLDKEYLNRENTQDNVLLGVMFLKKLLERYNNTYDALIHYNAGTKTSYRDRGELYAKKVLLEKTKLESLVILYLDFSSIKL